MLVILLSGYWSSSVNLPVVIADIICYIFIDFILGSFSNLPVITADIIFDIFTEKIGVQYIIEKY